MWTFLKYHVIIHPIIQAPIYALTGVEDGEPVGLPGHALAGVHVDARDVHLLSGPGHVDQVPQQDYLEEWVSEMIE